MKKSYLLIFIVFQVFILSISVVNAQDNPPLSENELEKYTYYFDIRDNQLVGDGSKFLTDEVSKNQFVLLGEYHHSLRISEFTKAIVPVFHDAGGRNLALEIGPVSAEILSELAEDPSKVLTNLSVFNGDYYTQKNDRQLTPIPFFKNTEDAEFLAEASKRKWNLIGLDQEFSHGYIPLLARIYNNLSSRRKKELKSVYEQCIELLKNFYAADAKGEKFIFVSVSESKEINRFLDSASEKNPQNRRIADAIRLSNRIYLDGNVNRKYYASNSDRVDYMKENLRDAFGRLKFNLRKDKMLLKMGANHAGRGFSAECLYEVGNTLSELAAINGNTSIHLRFEMRFYFDAGKVIDRLDDKNSFAYRFQPLLQMGKEDRWTVIDLRPLRSTVFYSEKYKLSDEVLDVFRNYDLYIIPKQEAQAKRNFDLRETK